MIKLANIEPVEYLIFGHITKDLTPTGPTLGGTPSYSGLTAKAIGLKVGIVTSWGCDVSFGPLEDIPIINYRADCSTTFENINTGKGREQIIHHVAEPIKIDKLHHSWKSPTIVHLGPMFNEVDPAISLQFPKSLIGATPKGWLRRHNEDGKITHLEHLEDHEILKGIQIAIISIEDVNGNETAIEEIASVCPILVVTEWRSGARVYWYGDVRHFNAPKVQEVDSTGAGDIFAAAFLIQFHKTGNPWEAARFANIIAANSVSRPGVTGVPTKAEVLKALSEVI